MYMFLFLNKVEKTLMKIGSSIGNLILNSDCDTLCWYISSDYKKIVGEESIKETISILVAAVEENRLDFDKKFKLPVLYLTESIKINEINIDKLYFQNVITADLINEYKDETDMEKNTIRYLSYTFNCSEDIITSMNKKDYETACELLNMTCIVSC